VNEWALYSFIGYRVCYVVFQVYAGVTEFSFEELRAIEYLKGNRPARCIQGRKLKPAIIPFIVQNNILSLVLIAFIIRSFSPVPGAFACRQLQVPVKYELQNLSIVTEMLMFHVDDY
jgi:hypothetical protein